jgi:acyl-coenzyme A synthetase/AMP-(fatty) acid ligase
VRAPSTIGLGGAILGPAEGFCLLDSSETRQNNYYSVGKELLIASGVATGVKGDQPSGPWCDAAANQLLPDGYLYLTDRLEELIKVKGFQVAPAELEALLYTHPDVADVAVIGRTDTRAGEVPVAYVVARGDLDREALKSWVSQRVCDHKQLTDVVLCDAIPKTPSGKILRRVLREQDARKAAGAAT